MKLKQLFRPRDKVVASLIGGLGNQMFQYAAGRALSKKLSCHLVLDSTPLQLSGEQTTRTFALDAFNINASIDTLSKEQIRRMLLLREKDTCNGWPMKLRRGLRLEGYWQSELYFKDIRPLLLEEFTLKEPPLPYIAELAKAILQEPDSVSIHFRRGDYISNAKAAQFHGALSDSYYKESIEFLKQQSKSCRYFVFSDEPAWVREKAPIAQPYTLIDSTQSSAAQELWLMSLCKHHIIANSSFSWWGAWLGSQHGLTLAPKNWFKDPQASAQESIIPSNWVRL